MLSYYSHSIHYRNQSMSFDNQKQPTSSSQKPSIKSPQEQQPSKVAFKEQVHNNQQQQSLKGMGMGIGMGLVSGSGIKSKAEVMSGYSFSRFEAISDNSDKDQQVGDVRGSQKIVHGDFSKKKVPTSTKVISSKKIIEEPIEVKVFHNDDLKTNQLKQKKHQYWFQYNYLSQAQLLEKFVKYALQRGFQCKIGGCQAQVIKRSPFIKSILNLCFPNSDFEHQVYQLTSPVEKNGRINQVSGGDIQYYTFREEFLLELWTDKYLVCGSLHQNIRHFLKKYNQLPKEKGRKGKIDELKIKIDKILKKIHVQTQNQKKNKEKSDQSKQSTEKTLYNQPQMAQLKTKIQQMQQQLKLIFQKQLKKEQQMTIKHKNRQKMLKQEANLSQNDRNKVLLSPSIERMLINMFYLHLDLEDYVKKYIISQKDIAQFERKKMIIKGSLSNSDIFKYLQLEELNKFLKQSSQQTPPILPQSIKLLNTVKHQSYPCPSQTLQLLSIFKTTLQKQIEILSKQNNGQKVKLQDYTNEDRTLLQFCVYCLIMCGNRDIFPAIQTVIVFMDDGEGNSKLRDFGMEMVKTVGILRKGIDFIQNQWEL